MDSKIVGKKMTQEQLRPEVHTLVTKANMSRLLEPITALFAQASHIALDTEFSGLGDPRLTRCP